MPIAHDDPAGAASIGLDDELGRADQVGLRDHLVACTPGARAPGRRGCARGPRRRTAAVNRPCTEQCPSTGSSARRAAARRSARRRGLSGSHTTQSSSESPSCRTAVLRPRCWSGRNSTLVSGRCSKAHSRATSALLDVQTAPPWRPQNALMSAEEFMYVTGTTDVGDARRRPARPRRPRPGRAAAMSAIEQPAARSGRITFWWSAVRMSADSAMKCTPQNTMYSASGPGRGLPGELERVAGDVGELDDLVALVVVAQHEDPRPPARPWRPAPAPPGPGRTPPAGRRGSRRRARSRGRCRGRAPAAADQLLSHRHPFTAGNHLVRGRSRCAGRASAAACRAARGTPPSTAPSGTPSRRPRPTR